MKNSINWFAIPAKDFDRACKFYGEILDNQVNVAEFGNEKMGMLPNFNMNEGGVGGHITLDPESVSSQGILIYLNGGKDLQVILDRIEGAGGKVISNKSASPGGFMAVFLDSEGNRIAIHNA